MTFGAGVEIVVVVRWAVILPTANQGLNIRQPEAGRFLASGKGDFRKDSGGD
jgi:hypothetical protein